MSALALPAGYLGDRSAPVRPDDRRRAAVSGAAAPVRLTRRGRMLVTLLFLAVLLTLLTAFGSGSAATGEAGEPVATRTLVVGSGDTLWDIAGTVAAPGEVGEMVYRIQELNALDSVAVDAGQRLAVPARG